MSESEKNKVVDHAVFRVALPPTGDAIIDGVQREAVITAVIGALNGVVAVYPDIVVTFGIETEFPKVQVI